MREVEVARRESKSERESQAVPEMQSPSSSG